MTTPFPFQSGATLLASQLNAITELVINDKTDSYTLVAGDAGEYVIMNKATATTLTVPNSVFTAGQIVRIVNKGAGVCTVTAGAGTTVSSTGTLALAQNATGTLIALSASAFIFEAGGVTQSAGGLVYITGASFSAVSSVSAANSTFTSTYENYEIIVNLTAASTSLNVLLRWRASGTDTTSGNYYSQANQMTFSSSAGSYDVGAGTSHRLGNLNPAGTYAGGLRLTAYGPQAARATVHTGQSYDGGSVIITNFGGTLNLTTQFDAFTLLTSTGTMTGTYRVYGYANS